MASSAMNILSGVAAAAAGLAGEKVSKTGAIPGLDIASILPALLGGKTGTSGVGGLVGTLASTALKSGVLGKTKLGGIADTLLSIGGKTGSTSVKASAKTGIEGLAAAIAGSSGTGKDIGSIATLAASLAGTAKNKSDLTGIASDLGKKLSSSFGVSLQGKSAAVGALDKVLPKDSKGDLFKAIFKGLT